jgi:hypothetical protein
MLGAAFAGIASSFPNFDASVVSYIHGVEDLRAK